MSRSAVKISQRLTTSQQWAAFIGLAILFTGLTFSYLVTSQLRQQLLAQQQQLATSLVKDASILLRSSLSKDDRISANVILKDWVDQELILSATLYNSTQQPIAHQINQGLVESLSHRELEVLNLINQGDRNKQIAETLTISVSTVKRHLQNIYQKLQVNSRTEAMVILNNWSH